MCLASQVSESGCSCFMDELRIRRTVCQALNRRAQPERAQGRVGHDADLIENEYSVHNFQYAFASFIIILAVQTYGALPVCLPKWVSLSNQLHRDAPGVYHCATSICPFSQHTIPGRPSIYADSDHHPVESVSNDRL